MKIGLALSGGGIRGIAHAGVLKALEENDIKIDVIGGTSSGGLIASLYALGYSPNYIYWLFKRYAKEITYIGQGPIINGIGNYMISRKLKVTGIKDGMEIENIYNELAKRKNVYYMKDIKIPVVIPSIDIKEEKEYIFTNEIKNLKEKDKYITDISVGRAVRASSSFPAVFCPCEFENHSFLDGGTLDNIPTEAVLKQGADKVISVNFEASQIDEKSDVMDIVMRTIDIMGNKISENSLNKSSYILTIPTDKVGLLDVEKADSCFQYGYNTTISQIEELKKSLGQKSFDPK